MSAPTINSQKAGKARVAGAVAAITLLMIGAVAMTDVAAVSRVPSAWTNWAPFAAPAKAVAPVRAVAPAPASASAGTMTSSPDAPTSVKFEIYETACSNGSTQVTWKVGSTTVATLDPRGDCTCNPSAAKTVTSTDPAVLAIFDNACASVSMTWNGQLLIGWSRVTVTRPSGTTVLKVMDKTGSYANNVCYAWESGLTYTSPVLDDDGDGIDNCSDPDLDNDGIDNALDNCPTIANANQADSDNNGVGNVCQAAVVAVPWLGAESVPHQVYSGGAVVLQAAALATPGNGAPLALASGTWDPGDGSGPQAISVSNPLALELTKTYTGAVGQPFTATISVKDTNNVTYTDTFKVVIAPNNRETKANMAIDKALWNLHKRQQRTTSDGLASGFWSGYSNYYMAATAGTVQAFEINNHRQNGDASKDPYVDDVHRGLRYILSQQHGNMQRMNVPSQNGNNPDANGNGYGLVVNPSDHSSYITGQVMDAIVASGTKNATAETGVATYVRGRKYVDIIQDLLDGYSYGMADNTGGWHYQYQGVTGNNDTSASHWWAIGVLASEVWGLDAPAWVRNIQWTVGVPLMQAAPGVDSRGCYFGYTNSAGNWWGDSQTNVTAAGLILMNADDIDQNNPRYTCAQQWLDSNWNATIGNFYTMYQTAKAMRTSLNSAGVTTPITMLNGTRDWYAAYADYLINNQNTYGTGEFRSVSSSIGSYIQGDMATSWGVIILSPGLFQLPPTAACVATPNELGTTGGTVNFSAAGSSHPDPNSTIVSYSWNFDDGSAVASGVTTSHAYSAPGSFPTVRNAKVTVTDDKGLSTTATCSVTIVDTNVKPAAIHGGPYTMCVGSPLTLDGSASFDSDGTVASYQWSWGSPMVAKATGAVVNATAAFTAMGPGVHDLGLTVTDNLGKPDSAFTTVTVLAASDPSCNQPPDAVNDAASTFSGTPVTVSVLANDTDSDVPAQTLVVTETTQGANGSVTTNGVTAIYTPNLGFAGTDMFTYTIADGHGGSDSATVTVTVAHRTATVTAGSGSKVYGSADPSTPPSSTGFLAADGITLSQTRDAGEDVGSYATSASASGAALANYDVTYVAGSLAITAADSTTVVTCTPTVVYTGAAQEVCSATVTGVNLSASAAVSYTDNINVGTASASASFAGDLNHTGSSGSANFAITPAGTTTVVACTPSVVYNGSAQEVCSATVTGANLSAPVTPVTYTDNTNVGTAGASATYAGDDNHTGSTGSSSFAITLANTTTVVTCTASVVYSGSAQQVCSAAVTGANLSASVTPVTYTNNVNIGTAGASATYGGDSNHTGSTGTATFEITAAPTGASVSAATITYAANGVVLVNVTSGSGTVLGNVSLSVDGSAPITQPLSGGSATFTLTAPNAGNHPLSATYAAQGNFLGTSATGNLHVDKSPTATTLTSSPSPQAAGQVVTLTATVVAVAPGSGTPVGNVSFYDGPALIGTSAVNGSGVAVLTTTTLSNGPHTITAKFNESANYLASNAGAVSQLIYGYPTGGGTFVIGNNNATLGNAINFWGSQWEKTNSMTGGASNASFKGFATGPTPPVVGGTFTAAPGNSAPSPAAVPQYIGIIVTSKVTKSGSSITGTIVKLVVVKVNPGYAGDPGNPGTGTIVAILP